MPVNPNLAPAARRGRPPRIDRSQIIGAALEMGLERFSLTDIAARLDVSTPALYSHVDGRDHVLRLAAAQVVAELEPDLAPLHDWREWLRRWAERIRTQLGGVGEELLEAVGANVDPTSLRVAERGLTLLTDAGFSPADAGYALWLVFRVACTAGTSGQASVDEPVGRARSIAADSESPHVVSAIAAIDEHAAERAFAFDLEVVVSGLQDRLRSQ